MEFVQGKTAINHNSLKETTSTVAHTGSNSGDNTGNSMDGESDDEDEGVSFRNHLVSMVTTFQQLSIDHFYGLKSYHSDIPNEWTSDLVNGYLGSDI